MDNNNYINKIAVVLNSIVLVPLTVTLIYNYYKLATIGITLHNTLLTFATAFAFIGVLIHLLGLLIRVRDPLTRKIKEQIGTATIILMGIAIVILIIFRITS